MRRIALLDVLSVLFGTALALTVWVLAVAQQDHRSAPQHPLSVSEQRDSIVAQEARKVGIPTPVAIAVSHIENFSGDSLAVSNKGAVGLMQVMPLIWSHKFEEDCGCGSLFPRRRNACLGVHVLKLYHDKHKTWEKTLRAYHGSNDHPQGREYIAAFVEAITAPTPVEHQKPALTYQKGGQ